MISPVPTIEWIKFMLNNKIKYIIHIKIKILKNKIKLEIIIKGKMKTKEFIFLTWKVFLKKVNFC